MPSRSRYVLPMLILCSLAGYLIIGYGIERTDFGIFIALFALLYGCGYGMIRRADTLSSVKLLVGAAIFFRLALLFALPNLSDDFYRFIWDGNLWVNGINPFLHTPGQLMQQGLPDFLSADLYEQLNSQPYYSVYPPVNQYVFGLSAVLAGTSLLGNAVVMKAVVAAAEIGSLWLMKKILRHFGISLRWLLVYALNPLVILELSGNLHFESLMIFFLLAAWYLWLTDRLWPAAACFTLAVNTKLVPLMLLPYLVFSVGWKRSAGLFLSLAAGTLLLHLPFLEPAFISHFGKSLSLYFQSFEFNASIYYLVRWVGFQVKGYNIIGTAAPVLAVFGTVLITLFSWYRRDASLRNAAHIVIVVLGIYYLFSTTVHPWYITTLLAFVPFTGRAFPLVWSVFIPLTYITYTDPAYTENLWLVALEYLLVAGAIAWDWRNRNRPADSALKGIFSPDKSL